MYLVYESEAQSRASRLGSVAAEFAGHIATAVWLGKLTDEAACEALWSYAMACCRGKRYECARMRVDLMAEYRHRRDGQDLCG
jgi:hypothetical protein